MAVGEVYHPNHVFVVLLPSSPGQYIEELIELILS